MEPLRRCPHCNEPWDSAHKALDVDQVRVIGCPNIGENARYYFDPNSKLRRDVTLEDVFAHELEVSMEDGKCKACGANLGGLEMVGGPTYWAPCSCAALRERRERIAKAALRGLLSNPALDQSSTNPRELGSYSVHCADALIAALDAKGVP